VCVCVCVHHVHALSRTYAYPVTQCDSCQCIVCTCEAALGLCVPCPIHPIRGLQLLRLSK
jgi:hypothetical protein